MDSKKILNLVTIVMFVITVVLLGLFMFGGEVPNQPYTTPVYTSTLLNWAYILCGIAIIAAIIFPVIRLFTRPKQAMKSFIGLAGVVVVILIGYALADGTPIKLVGYTGPDNVPSMLTSPTSGSVAKTPASVTAKPALTPIELTCAAIYATSDWSGLTP